MRVDVLLYLSEANRVEKEIVLKQGFDLPFAPIVGMKLTTDILILEIFDATYLLDEARWSVDCRTSLPASLIERLIARGWEVV